MRNEKRYFSEVTFLLIFVVFADELFIVALPSVILERNKYPDSSKILAIGVNSGKNF
jgi:hypothetical protein